MSTILLVGVVGMWFGVSVYIYTYFTELLDPPQPVRKFRSWRASSRLRKELGAQSSAESTVVYWDRYRNLSKQELFEVTQEFGWRYSDQRVLSEGWALDFVR